MGVIYDYFEAQGLGNSSAISQLPKGVVVPQEPFVPQQWKPPATPNPASTSPIDLSNLKDLKRTISPTAPATPNPASSSPTPSLGNDSPLGKIFNSPIGKAASGIGALVGLANVVGDLSNRAGYAYGGLSNSSTPDERYAQRQAINQRYEKALEAYQAKNIANGKGVYGQNLRNDVDKSQTVAGQNYRVAWKVTYADGTIGYGFGQDTQPNPPSDNEIYLFGSQLAGDLSSLASFTEGDGRIGIIFLAGVSTGIYFLNRGNGLVDGSITPYKIFPVDSIGNPAPSNPAPQTYTQPYGASSIAPQAYQSTAPNPPSPSAITSPSPNNASSPSSIAIANPSAATPQLAPSVAPTPQVVSPIANSSKAYATPSSANPSIAATQITATQTYGNGQTNDSYNGIQNPNQAGKNTANQSSITTTAPATPKTDPLTTPKPQTTPNTPSFPDLGSIALSVTGIGLTVGAIATGIDYLKNLNNQINEQTTPENQKANAKAGTCQAMSSDTCTLPLTNKISDAVANNPKLASDAKLNAILRNQLAQDGALAGIAAQIAELRATMLANFATAFTFFKNQVIDRAVNMLNLALNIHNALMLSETVGKTLGSILDAVISLTPLQFTDATTGAKTTATSALGQNASALIINIIGVDNYAKLKEDLAISNRIIKSSTNLFNGLQRILNSQSKQAQKTGVDVSNIGNALLANDVVNKNSYPKMANSQEANSALPADDADIISGKVGIIKQGIAGLNQITREIKSNVSQIKGIQRNFTAVTDLINGESKARKQISLQSQNEAKRKAKFKFLSIKQIKAKSK